MRLRIVGHWLTDINFERKDRRSSCGRELGKWAKYQGFRGQRRIAEWYLADNTAGHEITPAGVFDVDETDIPPWPRAKRESYAS